MTPEDKARLQIDHQLEQAGWIVRDFRQINISAGLASISTQGFLHFVRLANLAKSAGFLTFALAGSMTDLSCEHLPIRGMILRSNPF
jgi:hypothetical protein